MRLSRHLLVAFALFTITEQAEARSRGVLGTDCGGCHGYDGGSSLDMTPMEPEPGSQVTVRFTIRDPDASVAGINVELEDSDLFSLAPGSGLAVVSGGVTHTSPKRFSSGQAVYELSWQVPSSPGATRFSVGWVAGNGNGNNGGDEGHAKDIDVVYGCDSQVFYRDFDGDGFGNSDLARTFCAGEAPSGYAAAGGDCYEGSAKRYPGAVELCNQRDDDCDGEIDEGAVPIELFPDEDGDGFYSANELASGDSVMGCVPTPGYASEGGDCDADNPNAHPEGVEVCDVFTDEDCNGRVDDRVRPLCGVGWCIRESFSCDEADCTPGRPSTEICNFIDDDCDGVVDEGELCEEGMVCAAGECRDASEIGETLGEGTESSASADSAGEAVDSSGAQGKGASPAGAGRSSSSGCAYVAHLSNPFCGVIFLLGAPMLLWRRRRTASG